MHADGEQWGMFCSMNVPVVRTLHAIVFAAREPRKDPLSLASLASGH
jgi:hypothetical protein